MSQDAHETESGKRIQNALNKPYRVELDTCRLIMIIDPKPYQQILPNSNFSRGEKLHEV